MRRVLLVAVLATAALLGCSHQPAPQAASSAKHPWTDKPVLDSGNRFSFAIMSDFTDGRRAGIVEQAIDRLNLLQPSFVMTVGDTVQGYTEKPDEIRAQRDAVAKDFDRLAMRYYYLPGNHDISNLAASAAWTDRFGCSYYHFVYRDVLFICLNTEDPPDTHISQAQADYVLDVLARNKNVKWTFVLMHKPMWLEDGDNRPSPTWQAITQALSTRPHTVFAGHYHEYIQSTRNGHDYIVLSTTGGGSALRGPSLGEFDEITWVTMTDQGPSIANLELSGIVPKDVVTFELAKVNSALEQAAYLHTTGVASDDQAFKAGRATLEFVNDQPYELQITGTFAKDPVLTPDQNELRVVLPPGAKQKLDLTVAAAHPVDLAELSPMKLHFTATYTPAGRSPIAVPATFALDIRGTHEGTELLRNGTMSTDGDPWFTWVGKKEYGTVKAASGTMKVTLRETPNPWDAGFGQEVRGIRPGARYRLTVRAANTGGRGRVLVQLSGGEGDKLIPFIVNGSQSDAFPWQIAEEGQPASSRSIEFVVPRDAKLGASTKLILLVGDLRDASIDSVSLREIVGAGPATAPAPTSAPTADAATAR
jgi:hypothetical protein